MFVKCLRAILELLVELYEICMLGVHEINNLCRERDVNFNMCVCVCARARAHTQRHTQRGVFDALYYCYFLIFESACTHTHTHTQDDEKLLQ